MENKNTPERKAQFFALYWGQEVMIEFSGMFSDKMMKRYPVSYLEIVNQSTKNYWLELKPISQISDEDAIALGFEDAPELVKELEKNQEVFYTHFIDAYDADFLRSRGYVLNDYYGTVEEKVSWGWVKLREEVKDGI